MDLSTLNPVEGVPDRNSEALPSSARLLKSEFVQVHVSFYQILIRLQERMMVSEGQGVDRRHLEEVIDQRRV